MFKHNRPIKPHDFGHVQVSDTSLLYKFLKRVSPL